MKILIIFYFLNKQKIIYSFYKKQTYILGLFLVLFINIVFSIKYRIAYSNILLSTSTFKIQDFVDSKID